MLKNSAIAELLAKEAEDAKYPAERALRRAARQAFLWEVEAEELVQKGRPLTELSGVGPFIATLLRRWIDDPPPAPDIPPIRAGFLSIPEARRILDKRPSWLKQVRGDLQMHTLWSDGTGSTLEMARAAALRGYEYVAITDHSKGLKIAGGIDEAQLRQQAEEIRALNSHSGGNGQNAFLLRSIELNLNPQGRGDLQRASLRKLDVVLGCFHSSLRRPEDQTERYLAALRNPDIQILGHPRGRIYNFRQGLQADWNRVFGLAADLDKAIEIDGYPDRQDLSVDLLRIARKAGCRISLGTDSHGPTQLRFMELSAAAALLAKIEADRILNFMSKDKLSAWVEHVRTHSRN